MKRTIAAVAGLALALGVSAGAQDATVEKNVVYGMHSGLALLLDVHRPAKANGYGIIHVAGSGWHAPLGYDAAPLKESQIDVWGPPLVAAGYTVFSISHRAAPRFRYPAAVEDVQRAVRFVRHNARQYGVDPARLGGIGGSSGAHLVGLVAMLRAPGITDDPDPVNREAATLETVVLRAGPFSMGLDPVGNAQVSFMGVLPQGPEARVYAAASPITHVSPGAPPTLLLHGDADETVPYAQAEAMEKALRAANVPVQLLRIPGGKHGPTFGGRAARRDDWPDYLGATTAWFDRYLKTAAAGH
jgi:acetyl esterase/lipase